LCENEKVKKLLSVCAFANLISI